MLNAVKVRIYAYIDDMVTFSVDALEEKFAEKLLKYRRIKVPGFGIFELRRIKGRQVRHPWTGEMVYSPPYNKIRFLPTKPLRKRVQEAENVEERDFVAEKRTKR